MALMQVFRDPEIDRILAELNWAGWTVRLEQADGGWLASFRRLYGNVEEVAQSGDPKEVSEAIREAAAGTQLADGPPAKSVAA